MEKKTVELSKEQYETLLRLIYLGNWMVETYNEGDTNSDYYQLEQYLLQKKSDFDCDSIIEKDEEGFLSVTEDYEDISGLYDIIEEYNKEIFWDELSSRLSQKEFEDKFGKVQNQMTDEEVSEKLNEFSEKYNDIFLDKGIDAIKVD